MTISIGQRIITEAGQLSRQAAQCLALIDGGTQWLDWAVKSGSCHFGASDETELAQSVQVGLHGTPFCLLQNARALIGPAKLMSLSQEDLAVLFNAEAQDAAMDLPLTDQVSAALSRNNIISAQDLASLRAWLQQIGVSDSPLFQFMGVMDAACLVRLMRTSLTTTTDSIKTPPRANQSLLAAAAYSIAQARTPLEFADYLQFYQALDSQGKAAQAKDIQLSVLEQVHGLLDGPQMDKLPSPGSLPGILQDWFSRNRRLGFPRASLAPLRMVQRESYTGTTPDEAKAALWRFITSARVMLCSSNLAVQSTLEQDGSSCSYQLSLGKQMATLYVDDRGVISLDDYQSGTASPATGDI